jgi:hypothetical protein
MLHRSLAKLGTNEETLLDFVNRFGPLTGEGNRECGQEVVFAFSNAKAMQEILCVLQQSEAYTSRAAAKMGWHGAELMWILPSIP